jgi:flagellar protein FliS
MNDTATNAYLRSKVLAARPEELRLMLYDAAVRFATKGRDGLRTKNYEDVYEGLKSAKNILIEFISTLDHKVQPELCSRLSALYTYMYKRLVDAGLEKDAAIVDEVIELLNYERETWVMLMDQLAAEREGNTTGASQAATPQGVAASSAPPRTPVGYGPATSGGLSIEG